MSFWSGSKSKTYAPYEKFSDEYKGIVEPYYADIFKPEYYDYSLGDFLSGAQSQRARGQRGMEQNLALRGLSYGSGFAGYERSKLDRSYISNIAKAYLQARSTEEERQRLAMSGITDMFAGASTSHGPGIGYSFIGKLLGS